MKIPLRILRRKSMGTTSKEIGARLQKLLYEKHMSQRELSEHIGVREGSVSRYVRGERVPKADVAARIAQALGTTTDYILGRDTSDPEISYDRLMRDVERYSGEWTKAQKIALLIQLFD